MCDCCELARALVYSKYLVKGCAGKRNVVVNPGGYNRTFLLYQKNSVSVSWGCHNKSPQLSGLRKRDLFSRSLEGQKFKFQVCRQDCECCEGSTDGSFLTSSRFPRPQAFLGLWRRNSNLRFHLSTAFTSNPPLF